MLYFFPPKEKSVLEEIDVIVASLLDILLRTILEITSRPQATSSAMRLQFQDVTVRSYGMWHPYMGPVVLLKAPVPLAMGCSVTVGKQVSGMNGEHS